MKTDKRLIEVAFPLEQTSIESVHEKNVRHGHISTLHIWPARRPLAACRAALVATLLPDPGDKDKRDAILLRLAGRVEKTLKKKKLPSGKVEEIEAKETVGGILHWGRESEPDLAWFREEIRKAYGNRAPKVLDPFAGGGAIPLEAMRLGCDVTAADINPVAWFILKCTLEYPQKLALKRQRLPAFVLNEPGFMSQYLKARLPGFLRKHGVKESDIKKRVAKFSKSNQPLATAEVIDSITADHDFMEAELAWHVRAWGHWVLRRARKELAGYYPTYAEFCRLDPYERIELARPGEDQIKRVLISDDGDPQSDILNAGFDDDYLDNPRNPRWIAKPTVAYLWARSVICKSCRATVPLLKTRWLAKKDRKRVLLSIQPNSERTGVTFGIDHAAASQGGNPAQRREHDRRIGLGTMSRSGVQCPCCGTIMTMEDLRVEGKANRLGAAIICVVVDGWKGKEYRLPQPDELAIAAVATANQSSAFADVPHGVPTEPTPKGGTGASRAFSVAGYGIDEWGKLFTARQLVAFSAFLRAMRDANTELVGSDRNRDWTAAIVAYLMCCFDRMLDFNSVQVSWITSVEAIGHTFVRYALGTTWDYSEPATSNYVRGGWRMSMDAVCESIETISTAANDKAPVPSVICASATASRNAELFDIVVTDPPYYDAIPYSDLMDFFYVWLRRFIPGVIADLSGPFQSPLGPKWDKDRDDGELIDDSSRFDNDAKDSKENYERGMYRSFQACFDVLSGDGRLVIVFAHKHPDAWETLVAAIIRAGFVVDGSWPIQTEQAARMRAQSSAALASSVWLVCRKRDAAKRAGWDNDVLRDMEVNITQRLRDFWDAGIRGPDFVWAATGPALEAYSQYPAVKKATEPGALMTVSEFLRQVRRMVVDFVVGRVLSGGSEATDDDVSLDDVTTYYLLHRNDFGLKDAPAGACILYAVSCGLSEKLLADQYEILSRGKATGSHDDGDEAEAEESDGESTESAGSGGQFKLKGWSHRRNRGLGIDSGNGRIVPLIDQIHKLMHLWKAGDENKVNEFLDSRALRRSSVFAQLLQALIEKSRSEGQAEECAILEKLSNHLRKIGATAQAPLALGT